MAKRRDVEDIIGYHFQGLDFHIFASWTGLSQKTILLSPQPHNFRWFRVPSLRNNLRAILLSWMRYCSIQSWIALFLENLHMFVSWTGSGFRWGGAEYSPPPPPSPSPRLMRPPVSRSCANDLEHDYWSSVSRKGQHESSYSLGVTA